MPHIRHLMAYKRFIEHIYTLGTFTNCCLQNRRRRRWCWWRNERLKYEERGNEREWAHALNNQQNANNKKNYWVKLKRKSLMRIFCLICVARGRESAMQKSKIEIRYRNLIFLDLMADVNRDNILLK